jgi:Tfp pilus assembly PilM family ATPase/Tfp pilus assembly protein PilN
MAVRLVVEWTRATLRVAVSDGTEQRAALKALHTQPLGASGDVAQALRAVLKAAKSPAAQVIGVIPREQVITRVIKFPSTDAAELTQMAELYAKAQLPFPAEQAVIDSHVIQQEAGFSQVAIVACQREIIDRYLEVLRAADVAPKLLTVSSWGVMEWYRHAGLRSDTESGGKVRHAAGPPPAEPMLCVNIDDTRTDLVLVTRERILSARSLGQGAQEFTATPEAADLLLVEIERSRAAVRKELPGTEVKSLVLTGIGPLAEWREPLAQRLGLPLLVADPKQVARHKNVLWPAGQTVSPVVACGLAVADLRHLLNLSPLELRAHLSHRRQLEELTGISVLLGTVIALGAGLLGAEVWRQARTAAELDQALSEVSPASKQLQTKKRSIELVEGILAERRHLASVLSGVLRLVPPGSVSLEGLAFERNRQEVLVRGSAQTNQDVLSLIRELEKLEGVREVSLKYSTRRSTPQGERTDFEITVLSGEPPEAVS